MKDGMEVVEVVILITAIGSNSNAVGALAASAAGVPVLAAEVLKAAIVRIVVHYVTATIQGISLRHMYNKNKGTYLDVSFEATILSGIRPSCPSSANKIYIIIFCKIDKQIRNALQQSKCVFGFIQLIL